MKLSEDDKLYFSHPRPFPFSDRFFEVTDGFVRCAIKEQEGIYFDARVSVRRICEDFGSTEGLGEFRRKYNVSSPGMFKLAGKLGVDPWDRIEADYLDIGNLEALARKHGLTPKTISKGLKIRGIVVPKGRKPKAKRPCTHQASKNGHPSCK